MWPYVDKRRCGSGSSRATRCIPPPRAELRQGPPPSTRSTTRSGSSIHCGARRARGREVAPGLVGRGLDEIGAASATHSSRGRNEVMYHVGRPGHERTMDGPQAWRIDGPQRTPTSAPSSARLAMPVVGIRPPSPDHANAGSSSCVAPSRPALLHPHAKRIIAASWPARSSRSWTRGWSTHRVHGDYWLPRTRQRGRGLRPWPRSSRRGAGGLEYARRGRYWRPVHGRRPIRPGSQPSRRS